MARDPRVQQAHEHHQQSKDTLGLAAQHREQRDRLIRQLRAEDPHHWTYPVLAAAVGCSAELVAAIVKPRDRRRHATSRPQPDPHPPRRDAAS